jgi:hypothetical protein
MAIFRNGIVLAWMSSAVLAGCSSNPVTEDKNFDSKRTAEIIPIPVDVDTDLTRVYIKKPGDPVTPVPAPSATVSTAPASLDPSPALVAAANGEPPPSAEPKKAAGKKDRGTVTYRVKPYDTLMKISFALFGDLRRWREIAEQNPSKIGKLNSLTPGTFLHIRVTGAVDVDKNGDPYLIRRRDTLIKISDHLYGTPRKWWALWDNNRQLIHDPNRIYAGFTLYYHPDLMKRSFTQTPITPAETPKEVSPKVDAPIAAETSPAVEPVEKAPAGEETARAPAAQAPDAPSSPALAPSEVPETAPVSEPKAEGIPVSGA